MFSKLLSVLLLSALDCQSGDITRDQTLERKRVRLMASYQDQAEAQRRNEASASCSRGHYVLCERIQVSPQLLYTLRIQSLELQNFFKASCISRSLLDFDSFQSERVRFGRNCYQSSHSNKSPSMIDCPSSKPG